MENAIRRQRFDFAVQIVKLCTTISREKHEYVLTRQLIKSGTSIGANVREAQQAQSKKDFLAKMSIALKEADESLYWLELLQAADFLPAPQGEPLLQSALALKKLLTAIVKTTRKNLAE